MIAEKGKERIREKQHGQYSARIVCLLFLAVLVFGASGCGGKAATTVHVREDQDFSFIKKVAVLPLTNLTQEKFADEAIRQVVMHELLVSGYVDVAIPGDVASALDKAGIKSSASPTAEQIKSFGNALKAQAVIFGAVEKFGEMRSGNFTVPEVTITLMMADVSSGSIIWSVTKTDVGDSFMSRHFGSRADTMSELMLKVVRGAVRTLAK